MKKMWNSTIKSVYERFGEKLIKKGFKRLDCGSYRMVFHRNGIVIKVPHNQDGILDNIVEADAWRTVKNKPTRHGYYLAPCRLLKNKCLMMVYVDVDSEGELPSWAFMIDASQVGLYKNRYVAYDYALDVDISKELLEKYFGYF